MITKIDTLYGIESTLSRQILDRNIKKFWVSEDFVTSGDAIFKPWEYTPVKIRLEKKLFPEIKNISLWILKHLEISMRSCFAQSWIHIVWNFFNYTDRDDIVNLNQNWFVDIEVNVMNRWLADVEIKENTPFFRLYFRPGGNFITGNKLYEIIKEWKLKIEGEYGKTRCLVWANNFEINNEIDYKKIDEYMEAKDLNENEVDQALTLKLFLNGNKYIPNNHKWILIQSKKNLVDVLEPFDVNKVEHANHNFNIGETYYVDFGEYFWAIIYQWYDGWWHHIISPLIDPWFQWPIRTEIVKWWEFNDFIELHIYHKDG